MRFIFPIFLLLISCGGTQVEKDFDPPQDYESRSGLLIYQGHCEMCHGPDGALGQGGAKDLSQSKMDSAGIVNLLKHGKNGMPRQMQNFESQEEVENIIDLLKSLRK